MSIIYLSVRGCMSGSLRDYEVLPTVFSCVLTSVPTRVVVIWKFWTASLFHNSHSRSIVSQRPSSRDSVHMAHRVTCICDMMGIWVGLWVNPTGVMVGSHPRRQGVRSVSQRQPIRMLESLPYPGRLPTFLDGHMISLSLQVLSVVTV